MILDSTFLVDLERERRRCEEGGAVRFLQAHRAVAFGITFTIAGELAAGPSLGGNRERWEQFLRPFRFYDYNADVAWAFGQTYRHLRQVGQLIGANDLWIAATALAWDVALVTRNTRDFERVPQLKLLTY